MTTVDSARPPPPPRDDANRALAAGFGSLSIGTGGQSHRYGTHRLAAGRQGFSQMDGKMNIRTKEALDYLQTALEIIDAEGIIMAGCHVQHAIDLIGCEALPGLPSAPQPQN